MDNSIVYLLYLALYSFILLFYGRNSLDKAKDPVDFFLAGRKLGLKSCIASYSATWFSAASMQGVVGNVYHVGLITIFISILPWFLGSILHKKVLIRLKDYDYITIGEFLGQNYKSKGLQVLTGVLVLVGFLLYLVIPIAGFGMVISSLLDISYIYSVFLIYLFLIFASFGGMHTIAKTHRFNLGLMFLALFVCFLLVIDYNGSIFGIYQKQVAPSFSFSSGQNQSTMGIIYGILMSIFSWGMGLGINPQYGAQILAAKDKTTSQQMIKYSLILLGTMYFLR